MSLLDLVDQKRPEILRIAAKHGARNLRLFGSVARGEDHEGSDVDLLADYDGWGGDLERDLEQLLEVEVDIVVSPHPYLRDSILDAAIPLDAPNFRELAVLESQRPHMAVDRDASYIRLALDHVDEALEMAANMSRATFLAELLPQRGLIMTLILVGEYIGRLSPGFRESHPQIPRAEILGFRNVAVHHYSALTLEHTWDETVQVQLPRLKAQLEELI